MGVLGSTTCSQVVKNVLNQSGNSSLYAELFNAMKAMDDEKITDACSKCYETFLSGIYNEYSSKLSDKGYQANASLKSQYESLKSSNSLSKFTSSAIAYSKLSVPSDLRDKSLENNILNFFSAYFLSPLDKYAESLYTYSPSSSSTQPSTDITNSNDNTNETVDSEIQSEDDSEYLTDAEYELYGYEDYQQNKQKTYDTESQKYSKVKVLRSVFGMPYQFLPDTDRRLFTQKSNGVTNILHLDKEDYMGRKYIERIAQRANILFLTPGTVRFLKGASAKTKKRIISGFLSNVENSASIKGLLNDTESYRYYSFDFDVQGYFQYQIGRAHV